MRGGQQLLNFGKEGRRDWIFFGGTEVGRQAVMRWENGELARKMVNIGKNGEHWKNCVKTRSVWSDQGLIDPDSVR